MQSREKIIALHFLCSYFARTFETGIAFAL
jgi:hypothetical protein